MGLKIGVLSVYICITLFLYLSPLLMNSPCVTTVIPRKPLLVGHRGAQQLAPENTMSAFVTSAKYSVYGFESDVQISADGVPFLLHDKSLERTTNVEEVFPDRASDDPSTFNISDLKKLDAGSWYVTTDPFRNVDSLSETTKNWYSNQTIPKYTDWLEYAAQENKIVLFDLHQPPENHTYHETWIELVVNLTLTSSLPQHLVWWLPGSNRDEVMEAAPGFVQVSGGYEWFYNLDKLNKQYDEINNDQIQSLEKKNVSTNIYIVNSKWLFSLYWCIELPTVTTGACHELEKMEEPMWHLSPDVYLIVWITIDVVSAIIIVIIFFIQRHRYSEHHVAETISLASVSEQFNQESASTVKEKFRALLTRLRHRHLDHVPEVIGMHSPRRPKSSKRDEKLVLAPNENPEDQSISRDESHASINTADLPNGEISTDESLESLPQMNHTEIRVELS
ncbi:glycerophosphoinositol inositolphosphodiesterase GDPD2-like [Saccoglossus kowalevskii]